MTLVQVTEQERFWSMVKRTPYCWEWQGKKRKGYGYVYDLKLRRIITAQRKAYELVRGKIPKRMYIVRTCGRRNCVNPNHLKAVTVRENLSRASRTRSLNVTHCPKGHPYDSKNTILQTGKSHNGRGHRRCRACQRQWTANYYHRLWQLEKRRHRNGK
jgi:hypothetical protein